MALNLTTVLNGERKSWPLEGGPITIGRSSRHTLHLPDATVSKDHAEIVQHGDQWRVRDLGSRNGTRVNGVEATEPQPLKEGDLLEVGKVLVRVARDGAGASVELSVAGTTSSVLFKAKDILGRPATQTVSDPSRLVSLLAEAGRILVLPKPLPETCEEILKFVEKAIPANRLILLLRPPEGGEPVQMAARHRGGRAGQPLAISRTIMDTVLNECSSVVIGDATADARFRQQQSIVAQAILSAMAVPLFDNEKVLGLLYADTSDMHRAFGQEQLEVFTLLANMAAVKITNARLIEAETGRVRMAQELATATRIQESLLPPPPTVAGFECHARVEACFEVGGDLYDLHLRADGRLVILVGDVSGKGMGAAMLMSSVISSARTLYDTCLDPAELMVRLNAVMHRGTDPGHFVTMFLGCLDPSNGTLHFVNAGHNAPLLLRGGALSTLDATGIPIAVLPTYPYQANEIVIEQGDLLAIFTDGIPEATRDGEFFDDERLGEALIEASSAATLEEVSDAVIGKVDAFLAGTHRSDDVTLLLLRRT